MALNIPISVKEVAGVGVTDYPVSSVVPVPYGEFQNTDNFRVTDSVGTVVPASFQIIERWWDKDNSLRHVQVHFQATVGAFTTAGTGITEFFLTDAGATIAPAQPVTVVEDATQIVVNTGATSTAFSKSPFSITTANGNLTAEMGFYNQVSGLTEVQESFNRADIALEVEVLTDMLVVIRASAPTLYSSNVNHTHGWALRMYFYAGKSFVKTDFQLQNASKDQRFCAPMYFKYMNLILPTLTASTATSVSSVRVLQQSDLDIRGAVASPVAGAIIRNFTHTWPNKLNLDVNGVIKIELWPENGDSIYWRRIAKNDALGIVADYSLQTSDKYWLDDMQCVVKETMLNFSAMTAQELSDLANTVQNYPVCSIPPVQYKATAVTVDLGGTFPYATATPVQDIRKPIYSTSLDSFDPTTGTTAQPEYSYQYGWQSFAGQVERKTGTEGSGSLPDCVSSFFCTGDPADFLYAKEVAIGELNMRPHWLPGFTVAGDQALLELTQAPYTGSTWRFLDDPPINLDSPYLADTIQHANPRGDQHAWFYNVFRFYIMSGDLWVKDWYEFIAEFRKISANRLDNYISPASRADGHIYNHSVDAVRVTGDTTLLHALRDVHIPYIASVIATFPGDVKNSGAYNFENAFQVGYAMRGMINLYEELGNTGAQIDQLLAGYANWIFTSSNYGYYQDTMNPNFVNYSSATANIAIDPMIWCAKHYFRPDYAQHATKFLNDGLNGGAKALSFSIAQDFSNYRGGFLGQLYQTYLLGDYTPAGSDILTNRSLSSDGQPIVIAIDAIASDWVLSQAEVDAIVSFMPITGTINAVDGTKVTVNMNNKDYITYVLNETFTTDYIDIIKKPGTSAETAKKPKKPAYVELVNELNYPVTATAKTNLYGDEISTTESLSINLNNDNFATITLNEISDNLLTLQEQLSDMLVSGVTTAQDSDVITLSLNGIDYTTNAVSGIFQFTVPSADLQNMSSGSSHIATVSVSNGFTSTAVDTEDFSVETYVPPVDNGGGGYTPATNKEKAKTATENLYAVITDVRLALTANTVSYGASQEAQQTLNDITSELT